VDSSEQKFKLKMGDKIFAPAAVSKIRQLVEKGAITGEASLALPDSDDYKRIFKFKEFRDFLTIKENDKLSGPYTVQTISRMIKEKQITSAALIAHPLNPDQWHPITKVKVFGAIFSSFSASPKSPAGERGRFGISPPPPKAPVEKKYTDQPFFYVSVKKMIFLTVITLGLYELYWFYKQWSFVKGHIKSNIKPFWRSLFAVFFCQDLFKKVKEFSNSKKVPVGYNPELLALMYIVLTFCWKLPEAFSLISIFSLAALLIVQKSINILIEDYRKEAGITVPPKKKSKLLICIIAVAAFIAVLIGGIIAIYIVQYNKDITVESLKRRTINDLKMSIVLPGVPIEGDSSIISNPGDSVIVHRNYALQMRQAAVRLSYAEFSGAPPEPGDIYNQIKDWISNIGLFENMTIRTKDLDIGNITAKTFVISYDQNSINITVKGGAFVRGSEVWAVAVFFETDTETMNAVSGKIMNSIHFLSGQQPR